MCASSRPPRSRRSAALAAALGAMALAAAEEAGWRRAGHPGEGAALVTAALAAAAAAAVLAALLARRAGAVGAVAVAVLAYAAGAWWLGPRRVAVEPPRAPGAPPGSHGAGRPDIVLVVMDTTRRDHLSLYGYPRPTTPALDALAPESEVYDDAWSAAPWTPPSHASLLTGLLPSQHGVDGQDPAPFPAGLLTLQRVLRAAGYRTGGFVANPNLTAAGWDRDFDEYRSPRYRGRHSLLAWLDRWSFGRDHADAWTSGGLTRRTLDLALEWWGAHEGSPRFLFVNLLDPHRPYVPPRGQYRRFLAGVDPGEAFAVEQDPDSYQLRPGLGERQAFLLRGLYDAEVASMDAALGAFVAALRGRGELDRAILAVTSDHGERLGERGLVGHEAPGDGALDATLLRVPLLIRFPPGAAPRRVPGRMPLTRVAARLLELARIPIPDSMRTRGVGDPDLVIAQMQHPAWILGRLLRRRPGLDLGPLAGDRVLAADLRFACVCRAGPGADGGCVLNDMAADPGWTRDAGPAHPEALARLRRAALAVPAFQPPRAAPADPELLERLRALGYLP